MQNNSRPLRPLPRIDYPHSLPIVDRKEDIVRAVRMHPVIVITGETGSGKTTQIPKMCLEAGRGVRGMIGCTQPRRVAAVTVARRIAEEMGETVGLSVGYKIRFEDRSGPCPLIKLMTDGILLMEAQTDPRLSAYDTIIVDEAHERSLNIDFVLGMLRRLTRLRSDLKVIITSATLDREKFSRAFDDAPMIEVSGRMYPVELRYAPLDPGEEEAGIVTYIDAAVRAVEDLTREGRRGDILIFMPTEQDIRETCDLLEGRAYPDCLVLPMFARLSWREQHRVFQASTLRKIIVATNVAETSITIPGIRYVVDTGLVRISQYNPRTRTTSLPIRPISRSSAEQRKGRCGRVRNGICIRLYGEEDYEKRPPFASPEILRANLAEVVLRMLSLRLGDISGFPFIDPPGPRAIRDGINLLQELGAVERADADDDRTGAGPFRLTKRGRRMARLPMDPRISRMLLEAERENCTDEVAVIASALCVQDPRERPLNQEQRADQVHAPFLDPTSDFITLLRIWNHCHGRPDSPRTQGGMRKLCRECFLSYRRMREWREVHHQILAIADEQRRKGKAPKERPAGTEELNAGIHKSILSGYLSNIAVKQEKNLYAATQGRQAMIFPGSGLYNRGGNWIVAAEMVETTRLYARTAANIDPGWLEGIGGPLCRSTYLEPRWEKNRGEVVATEQVSLFGLVIIPARTVSFGRIDPEAASRIFIRGCLVEGSGRQPWPFLAHNRKLAEDIAAMESKIRRHDLLADEESIARFYEERLPGVYDVQTLRKRIRDRGGDQFLRMKEEDLMRKSPNGEAMALYPDAIATGRLRFRLSYRFEPGHPEDGATLRIPVHLLSKVPEEGEDWLVPGFLREKIDVLVRGLPKEFRKGLQPLSESIRLIQSEIRADDGPLLSALGKFVRQRFGVDIPASAWPVERLPEHLKLRYAVLDDGGKELSSGRDLRRFRKEVFSAAESEIFQEAKRIWEREGLTQWDFGDLPEEIPLERAGSLYGFAYLGIEAGKESAAIRLYPERLEAEEAHRFGVMMLYALRFRRELKDLKKALALGGDLKVWASAFGGHRALEDRLFERVQRDLFALSVRTEEAFRRHGNDAASRMLQRGRDLLREIKPLLKAAHETLSTLKAFEKANRYNEPAIAFLKSLKEAMNLLLPEDFFLKYDAVRLAHLVRYLKALAIRAERGLLHLEKDREKERDIEPYESFLREQRKNLTPSSSDEKRRALDDFGWLLEEYRVSRFAQELKTPQPVSKKRLDEKKRNLERMA